MSALERFKRIERRGFGALEGNRRRDQLPPPAPFTGAVSAPLLFPGGPLPTPTAFGELLAPPVLFVPDVLLGFFILWVVWWAIGAPVCGSLAVGLLASASAVIGSAAIQTMASAPRA